MAEPARTVTMLLHAWRAGDRDALAELMPLVYRELHRIADRHMRGERPGHSLRATDLVSEAYLRLADAGSVDWQDRVHFFAIAARSMRKILIDRARRRDAAKRGDGARAATFDEGMIPAERPDELIVLDGSLEALAKLDERKARVIELHYFGGLTQDEIAAALGVHVNTVSRDLRVAEAWLHRRIRGDG